MIRVEVARTAAVVDRASLDESARRAIQTRGRSAVDEYLDADDPPERLVVSTAGVRPA
jgi:hypothetical protein